MYFERMRTCKYPFCYDQEINILKKHVAIIYILIYSTNIKNVEIQNGICYAIWNQIELNQIDLDNGNFSFT